MLKIKAIQINLPIHSEAYVVGANVKDYASHAIVTEGFTDAVVTEIKDIGIEYEGSYHAFYEVYADKKLFKRIEYTPVSLTYGD